MVLLFFIAKTLFLFAVLVTLVFALVFIELILFGSSIDPDDNGILRTKEQKELFRQKKLLKMEKYNDR